MLDREAIYGRFARCYSVDTPAALASYLGVKRQTVYEWKSGKRQVPWNRLKSAVDSFHLSWDWLLEGKGSRCRPRDKVKPSCSLDRIQITRRFLELFRDSSQTEIAKILGISPVAVHYMFEEEMNVPWDKLVIVVKELGATWEWLLEERGKPKFQR